MTLNRKFTLALFSLFISGLLNAQTLQLSLQDALNMAKENNLLNKQAEARIAEAKASFRMTNAVFLPEVELSHTGITTNDPLSSFGFKLKQEIVAQEDFAPDLLNNPDNIENFNSKVEFKQPIFNLDGIYARRAAKNQLEAVKLQSSRVMNNIYYEVKKAYYLLDLTQLSVEVLTNSVEVAQEVLRLLNEQEKQGYAKSADVLEASVRLEERKNQLSAAQNQQQAAHDYLAHLLGIDIYQEIETLDSLVSPEALLVFSDSTMQIEERSDIQSYKKQIEAGENMLRSNRMEFVPRVNAFGSMEWNDDKVFGTSASNYMVGASLSWKIFSGYKNVGAIQLSKAKLEEAKYGYDDYLSQSNIQINNALRNIKLAYQKIESGKLSREQARESLRIRSNRFAQGLEKTADLLMAETLASQKELEYIQSIYNYRLAIFEIEYLTENKIQN